MAKANLATHVDAALLDRARNAAYWLRRPLSAIVGAGLAAEVAKLERKHNKGNAFQKRAGDLTRGARPK